MLLVHTYTAAVLAFEGKKKLFTNEPGLDDSYNSDVIHDDVEHHHPALRKNLRLAQNKSFLRCSGTTVLRCIIVGFQLAVLKRVYQCGPGTYVRMLTSYLTLFFFGGCSLRMTFFTAMV